MLRALLAITAGMSWAGATEPVRECATSLARPCRLESGKPVHRQLAPSQPHRYTVRVAAGSYTRVVVEQTGVDAAVLVVPPGAEPFTVDGFDYGEEPVSVISEQAGTCRLELSFVARQSLRGDYTIRLVESRPATRDDKLRQRAEMFSTEARRERKLGTGESITRAIETAARAIARFQESGDRAAELRMRIQWAEAYDAHSEYEAAGTENLAALEMSRAVGDRRGEAEIANNLGMGYWRQGRPEEALRWFDEALRLWQSLPVQYGRAATLSNLGLLSRQMGDLREAIQYYAKALDVLTPLRRRDGQAFVFNNMGLAYAVLGEYDRSLAYLRRALPLFTAARDGIAQGRALTSIARVALLEHDTATARTNLARALPLVRASGDRRALAEAMHLDAQIHRARGLDAQAVASAEAALDLFRTVHDRRGEANVRQTLGGALASTGRQKQARELLSQALELQRQMQARESEAAVLYDIAALHRTAGDLADARQTLESAITIIERLRSNMAGEQLRTSYLGSRLDYYRAHMDVLMRMYAATRAPELEAAAFESADGSLARSLVDLLNENRWLLRRGADLALLERKRKLQQEIGFRSFQMSRWTDAAQVAAMRARLEELIAEFQGVEDRIRSENPHYANLVHPSMPSLAEVQRELLDGDSVLLEYALGEPRSYLWVISRDAVTSFVLPGRAEIERPARLVSAVMNAGGNRARQAHNDPEFQRAIARLGRILLAPARGLLTRRRVVIVPDGGLQYVPFTALAPKPGGAPLVSSNEVVLLPSMSTLAALRKDIAGRKPAPRPLAIIADPVFDAGDSRVHASVPNGVAQRKLPFPRLVFSAREAATIATLFPPGAATVYTNFQASKAELAKYGLAQYRILHFSTHGILDTVHPELSGLVLSLVDRKGVPRDGFLRLHEIYELDLPADLVVLGACRTALGREIRGEGLMALTRGFLYAGAARVVASLWPADDEASGVLVSEFYRGMIKEKLRPAEALRRAQNRVRVDGRWNSPFFWASTVLQGEWR